MLILQLGHSELVSESHSLKQKCVLEEMLKRVQHDNYF